MNLERLKKEYSKTERSRDNAEVFFTFMCPCIVTNFFVINQLDASILQIYFVMKFYMFRTVCLSIIRSLFTVHSTIVYVIGVFC